MHHELGSDCRQLESAQGPCESEVGQADRRRLGGYCGQARATGRETPGALRLRKSAGGKGTRRVLAHAEGVSTSGPLKMVVPTPGRLCQARGRGIPNSASFLFLSVVNFRT